MKLRDISTADLLVMSAFRVVMIVFSVMLIVVGMKDWCSKPTEEIPFGGIVFVSIVFVGSAYDLLRLTIDYWNQEIKE